MKQFKLIVFTIISICLLGSCGGSKKAVQQSSVPTKQKIVLDECQELAQAKPEIRAWGEGVNFSLSSASNFAELQARAKFARAVAAKIKAAEESNSLSYGQESTNSKNSERATDFGRKQQEMQLSIAEETIKNAVVIKTSQYMNQDGSYQVFVCLEYREGVAKLADDIANKVRQRVPDDDRLKMDYEFQKFRDRIEEELKKSKYEE